MNLRTTLRGEHLDQKLVVLASQLNKHKEDESAQANLLKNPEGRDQ
jgi:hypothetical protein